MAGHAHRLGRHRLHPVELRQHAALGGLRVVVQHPGAQPGVRHGRVLPKHPALQLRHQHRWQ